MTMCPAGGHEYPVEDSRGAYCPTHGITQLFRGEPIRPEDLMRDYPAQPEWVILGPAPDSDPPRDD